MAFSSQQKPAAGRLLIAAPAPAALDPKMIAQAAYYRWLKRGCAHGGDRADWLAAEQDLRAQLEARRA